MPKLIGVPAKWWLLSLAVLAYTRTDQFKTATVAIGDVGTKAFAPLGEGITKFYHGLIPFSELGEELGDFLDPVERALELKRKFIG